MDTSKLPKIQDEDRESQFGYVHGVSGPGLVYSPCLFKWLESIRLNVVKSSMVAMFS